MTQPKQPLHAPRVSTGAGRLVKLAAIAAVGGVFLIGSAGALAQTTQSGDSKPAQKTPAKPGAQAGDAPKDGSSHGAGGSHSAKGSGGAEKTPAKPGAQSGKEPK